MIDNTEASEWVEDCRRIFQSTGEGERRKHAFCRHTHNTSMFDFGRSPKLVFVLSFSPSFAGDFRLFVFITFGGQTCLKKEEASGTN